MKILQAGRLQNRLQKIKIDADDSMNHRRRLPESTALIEPILGVDSRALDGFAANFTLAYPPGQADFRLLPAAAQTAGRTVQDAG
ncbi:MAG: hypothetical protein HZB19_06090 [Chloroflexi bacterium]|nr:hypothetical protein [Chloroflexota bacterium]